MNNLIRPLQEKIIQSRNFIESYADRLEIDRYPDPERAIQKVLSCFEIEFLEREMITYGKGCLQGQKNEKRAVKILETMPFFMKFDDKIMIDIIRNCKIRRFKRNDFVFHEGDQADSLYIVLSGACEVMIKQKITKKEDEEEENNTKALTKNSQPLKEYKNVASIFEGMAFGEFALLPDISEICKQETYTDMFKKMKFRCQQLVKANFPEKDRDELMKTPLHKLSELKLVDKVEELTNASFLSSGSNLIHKKESELKEVLKTRTAGIRVSRDATLLQLTNQYFNEVLIPIIKPEYKNKWALMNKISLFSDLTSIQKLVISNFMVKKIYHYGDLIVKKGQLFDSLLIISKGECAFVWRKPIFVPSQLEVDSSVFKPPLKKFMVNAQVYPKNEKRLHEKKKTIFKKKKRNIN